MSTNVSINKIMVPVDGSKPSEDAVEYAIDIAKRRNAKLIVVHVMHLQPYTFAAAPLEGTPPFAVTPVPLAISNKERKMGEDCVNRVQQKARRAGVTVEMKIIEDQTSIVHAITKLAETEACDLIVMGTKGRTGIKKFLLGSVASGVVTYAPCPVLVVR